jgi:hypothetical protein
LIYLKKYDTFSVSNNDQRLIAKRSRLLTSHVRLIGKCLRLAQILFCALMLSRRGV